MRNTKKMRFKLLFVVLLFTLSACQKQNHFDDVPYVTVDGIVNNSYILDMAIDANNVKWFATTGGLVKLTGSSTTVYKRAQGMDCDTLTKVTTDANGDVWCITYKASILQFNGSSFIIHKPSTPSVHSMAQPTAITIDNNNHVMISTLHGLYTYNGSNWSVFYFKMPLEVSKISNLCKHPLNLNNILITQDDNKRFTFDGNSIKPLDSIMGFPSDSIRCLTTDANGKIYCGITVRGLLVPGNPSPHILSLGIDWSDNAISDIAVASNNRIWVATANSIAYIDNGNIHRYRPGQLPIYSVEHIRLDRKNKLWFYNMAGVYTIE